MIEFDPPRSIRVEINDRREYVEYVPRDQLDDLRQQVDSLTAERNKLVQDKLIDLAGMSCPECVDTRIDELTAERDELRELVRRMFYAVHPRDRAQFLANVAELGAEVDE